MMKRRPAPHGSRPVPAARTSRAAGAPSRGERLQKVLAAAGVGSRRDCEALILAGRVEIDRKVVDLLGTRVDLDHQEVRLDGVPLRPVRYVYFVLNKPPGVISTNRDPQGRKRVVDLLPDNVRLFSVGRLDRFSEGLLLLTNDGDLANRLTHPRYGVEKTYRVRVAGHPTAEGMRQLRKGVYLAEGFARVAGVRIKRRYRQSTELEMVLDEGRNREVRRLLARIGHKVIQLRRVAIGPLRLGEMPVGSYRPLTSREVRDLRKAGAGDAQRPKSGQQRDAAGTASKPGGRSGTASKPGGRSGTANKTGGRAGTASKPGGRAGTANKQGGRSGTASKPGGRSGTANKQGGRAGTASKPGGRTGTANKQGGRSGTASKQGGRAGTANKQGGRSGTASKPGGRTGTANKPGGRAGTASKPGGRTGTANKQGGRTGTASKPGGRAGTASKQGGRSGTANKQGGRAGTASKQGGRSAAAKQRASNGATGDDRRRRQQSRKRRP